MSGPLAPFSPVAQAWFAGAFAAATPVQERGWAAISAGEHALLLAPTGSGKTLAAFYWCLDRICCGPPPTEPGVRAVYLSPLKALVYDIERNLRAPLAGLRATALRLGLPFREPRVGVRTGDTPQAERERMLKQPPEILVTTPESLFLLLSGRGRQGLGGVQYIIVDEIHAVAGTKRGVHLALSVERLSSLCREEPQRIGLSATQRPLQEIARFLGGDRPVQVVDCSAPPTMDLEVVVPLEDLEAPPLPATDPALGPPSALLGHPMSRPGADTVGIWAVLHPHILALIRAHRSTIVFTNSRRVCERLCAALNALCEAEGQPAIARAHHGSISHQARAEIEDGLKSGRLTCIVATSSLELGIDMGAVDLVIQVESPGAVSAALQRVGRAGHQVGGTSKGRVFPKFKGDLLETAAVVRGMRQGRIEPTRVPRNALDVLAQHIVSMALDRSWRVEELLTLLRRSWPYRDLSAELLSAVLDMLAGRPPAGAEPGFDNLFAELRPRIVLDRATDELRSRKDAAPVLLANAGTIPDRGLYGVYIHPEGPRVGELDEEMVFESRKGDVILLGASGWRIVDIQRDRVTVSPAPGEPGRMPFWRGEELARPVELGRALGELCRELSTFGRVEATELLRRSCGLDERAVQNLLSHVEAQREATGLVPSDQALVVERFRDELGDWRLCILSPWGARVHAPWGMALAAALEARGGRETQVVWTDDGIVLRFGDTEELPRLAELFPDPEELEGLLLSRMHSAGQFAARFREAAGRSLLLPRRRPGQRTPLWQQRMKAAELLARARQLPGFPLVLEAVRELMQDVFDLPALHELLAAVRSRKVRVEEVESQSPSPFARSLVFAWVAEWLYSGDAPLAEKRMAALSLDMGLLRELLGSGDLRELLDPGVIEEVEQELSALSPDRRARTEEGLMDLLRRLGELDRQEIAARCEGEGWLEALVAARRAVAIQVGGVERFVLVDDVARYRDGLGVVPPGGIPSVLLGPAPAALDSLVLRYARCHGPFGAESLAQRWGWTGAQLRPVLQLLVARGLLLTGSFRSEGVEYCDPEVLRRIKRRCLARLRGEVEPVEPVDFARFLLGWQGLPAGPRSGAGRLAEVLAQLEGLALPFSELEGRILPARLPGYAPWQLDELGAMGEIVWTGAGALGPSDGRVALWRRERLAELWSPPEWQPESPAQARLLELIEARGACFASELQRGMEAAGLGLRLEELQALLWDLVWAGLVTNDTLLPLRQLASPRRGSAGRLAGGRWSALRPLATGGEPTRRALSRAALLMERYGLVMREVAQAEELVGGFAGIYPLLSQMEEAGRLRRGWFVAGLGGAQFGAPGAVDRLRDRPAPGAAPAVLALAACDPACAWGGVLAWPEGGGGQPRRSPGATVVLVDAAPVLWVDRGGRSLITFGEEPERLGLAVASLRAELGRQRARALRIQRVDGVEVGAARRAPLLLAAGFERDLGGILLQVPL